MSASNLAAALSDSLRVCEALPLRTYAKTDTRADFDTLVQALFAQLKQGCGRRECTNTFCRSCPHSRPLTPAMALSVALVVAAEPDAAHRLCAPMAARRDLARLDLIPRLLVEPNEAATATKGRDDGNSKASDNIVDDPADCRTCTSPSCTPFLLSLLRTTPFRSLFGPSLPNNDSHISTSTRTDSRQRTKLSGVDSILSERAQNCNDNTDADINEGTRDETVALRRTTVQLSLTHLSLSMICESIASARRSHDLSFLHNTIRTVIVSPANVSSSFREHESPSGPHILCVSHSNDQSNEPPLMTPLDLGAASQGLQLLVDVSDATRLLVAQTFERLLATLIDNQCREQSALRRRHIAPRRRVGASTSNPALAVSPIVPLLLVLQYIAATAPECPPLTRTAELIALLNAEQRLQLVQSLSCLSTGLIPVIHAFHSLITAHVSSESPILAHACAVMSVLFDASSPTNTVPLNTFYNTAACTAITLNIKDAYSRWRLRSRRAVSLTCGSTITRHDETSTHPAPQVAGSDNLLDFPFLLTAEVKARVIHLDAVVQMSETFETAFINSACVFQVQKALGRDQVVRAADAHVVHNSASPYLVLEVRRSDLLSDALRQLESATRAGQLKRPVKVKFVDGGEQGLDMGGVSKEFFQTLIARVFHPDFGMFEYCDATHCFWFHAASLESTAEFALVGKLLGLAIYNGVILNLRVPRLLWKKLLNVPVSLVDLADIQPELARGLQAMLAYDDAETFDEVFCQTMAVPAVAAAGPLTVDRPIGGADCCQEEVCVAGCASRATTDRVELVPNGDTISVTLENRDEFVKLYVSYLLCDSIAVQFSAFQQGFVDVCGGPALELCAPEELELLVCGQSTVDVSALEAVATYDGYTAENSVVVWLWQLLHSMTEPEVRQFLQFVTASDRVPVQGFATMSFVVQRNGQTSTRLPTSLTCFNRLLLPDYPTKICLRDRLWKAMEHGGEGFGLV